MIKKDSRYVDGTVVAMSDGTVAVFRNFPQDVYRTDVRVVRWDASSRLDRLARRYGQTEHWWRIMDVNPERADPWEFTPNDHLRIPNPASRTLR